MSSSPTSTKNATNRRRRNRRLPSCLYLDEPVDASRHVLIIAGVGLQFEQDRQGSRDFADPFERNGEFIKEPMRFRRCRRLYLDGALQPLDCLPRVAALEKNLPERGCRPEAMCWRPRCSSQPRNRKIELAGAVEGHADGQFLLGIVGGETLGDFLAEIGEDIVQVSRRTRRSRRRLRRFRLGVLENW